MKLAKLKHPVSVGNAFYGKGVIVEVVDASHPLVQEKFPGIMENSESRQIAVIFPGKTTISIGLVKSFEYC